MKRYTVYEHITPSGKKYIGITCQEPETRWKNGNGYKDNPYFYRAIEKYGWNNIEHRIICTGFSKEAAEAMEIALIDMAKSTDRRFGYNIAPGGSATTPTEASMRKASASMTLAWADEEKRERMRESMRGRRRSEASRENISAAQKKRFENQEEREKISARQIGRKRTEEAKAKTSKSLKKYYSDGENLERLRETRKISNRKKARPVFCVETGKRYEAVADAEKETGISHQNIIKVCRGNRPVAGGYHWVYG